MNRPLRTRSTIPVLLCLALVLAKDAAAQHTIGPDAPPDTVAAGFQDALRARAWDVAAALMHPDALESFRRTLKILTDADTSMATWETLLGRGEPVSLEELSPSDLFTRAAQNLMKQMPGMANSLADRRVTVLGAVREPPDLAHVVYRNRDLLQGAVPEVLVMTLERTKRGWRVVHSRELELIREALRGLARTRYPPNRSLKK